MHERRFGLPQNEESKTESTSFTDCHKSESNGFLCSIVTSEGSSVRHYGPEKEKPFAWISPPPFSQEEKVQDWSFHWEMHAHCFWHCGIFIHQRTWATVRRATPISLTVYVPCVMFQCVDKPKRRNTSYEWSLLSINWLYMFRTITSPLSGASSHKLYNTLVCSCYPARLAW